MPKIGSFVTSVYREESSSLDQWTAAMCLAWPECSIVTLDRSGIIDGEHCHWFSINSLRQATMPALTKHGLYAFWSYSPRDAATYAITCEVRHSKSDQYVASTQMLPVHADSLTMTALEMRAGKALGNGILQVITESVEPELNACVADSETPAQRASFLAAKQAALALKDGKEVGPFLRRVATQIEQGNLATGAESDLASILEKGFRKEVDGFRKSKEEK